MEIKKILDKTLPLVPAKQEFKLPASSEEGLFAVARQNQTIAELLVIDPEATELREALRYCMVKVGLRGNNFPVGPEKMLLLNHITNEYRNHTPAEIKLAFDLALSAKLGLDTKDVKCYESFSCLYFSTIMNAYRGWAAQVARQQELEESVKEVPPTPEQLEQIEKEYQEFLQTPLGEHLFKAGKIK